VRILLAGCDSPDGLGFTTRAVRGALARAGHDVAFFDYRARRVLPARRFDALFRVVRRAARAGRLRQALVGAQDAVMGRVLATRAGALDPELVLVLKGDRIAPEVLTEIRAAHAVPVVNWFTDPLVDFRELVARIAPAYDVFFTIDDVPRAEAGWIRARRIVHLPTACDPHVHRPVRTADGDHARFACDVCFVGRFGRRATALADLTDLRLNLWGSRLFAEDLRRFHRGDGLWGDDLAKQYGAARIALNVHAGYDRADAEAATYNVNPRLFEIPACGGFQLTDNRAQATRFFDEGAEIACFGSREELRDRVRHYLARDDERRRMAARAGEKARTLHTYDRRVACLLEAVGRG
jgi:spore maturation protein CgeB